MSELSGGGHSFYESSGVESIVNRDELEAFFRQDIIQSFTALNGGQEIVPWVRAGQRFVYDDEFQIFETPWQVELSAHDRYATRKKKLIGNQGLEFIVELREQLPRDESRRIVSFLRDGITHPEAEKLEVMEQIEPSSLSAWAVREYIFFGGRNSVDAAREYSVSVYWQSLTQGPVLMWSSLNLSYLPKPENDEDDVDQDAPKTPPDIEHMIYTEDLSRIKLALIEMIQRPMR